MRGEGSLDVAMPDVAHVCDSLVGGSQNFAADRQLARRLLDVCPAVRDAVRENGVVAPSE